MASARWTGGTFVPGSNSIKDDHVDSSSPLGVTKVRHLHKPGTNFALAIGGTPVAREEIVYVARGAATIRGFHCLLNDTGTDTDLTFDLKKNGVSILSAAVQVEDTDADKSVQDGTISNAVLVADDILSIALAVTDSTGAQGPFAWVEIDELAG